MERRYPPPDAIQVTLTGRWRDGAAAGDDVDTLHDQLHLRLGGRALTAHLDPVPVVATVTKLAHAVADVLDGGRRHVTTHVGDEPLELRRDDGLQLSLGLSSARPTLVAAPVDGDTFRASLLTLGHSLLEALPVHPATELLADAIDRLDSLRRPRLPFDSSASDVTPAVVPSGRGQIAFGFRSNLAATGTVQLEARLGPHVVPGGRATLVDMADALVAAVEAALQTRNWPDGLQSHSLDAGADRRLAFTRADGRLFVSVVDRGTHDLCPRVEVTLPALARAVRLFVERTRAHARPPDAAALATVARTIDELDTWARALAEEDVVGSATPPDGWSPYVAAERAPDRDPLPVRGLHHMAYRRGWRREAPGLRATDAHGDLLLVYDIGGLTALQRPDGVAAWHIPDLHPLDDGPPGFATARDGGLVCFDARTGARLWRAPRGGADASPRRVHTCGSVVLVEAADRALRGLDAATGRRVWRRRTCFGAVLGVASHGPLAWMAAEDGFAYGLRVADGAERFRVALPGDPEGPPVLCEAGLLLTVHRAPADESSLVMLDPLTGATRWDRGLDGTAARAPQIVGDTALVVLDDGAEACVARVDLTDGATRWQHPVEPGAEPAVVRGVGERVFAKSADGSVCALDLDTGAPLWTVDGDDPELSLMLNAPPVVARGVLLVPGTRVRVIDPDTGRVVQALDCAELVPGWLHAWPDGDLAIAEDDAVAHYLLGGHLALVG